MQKTDKDLTGYYHKELAGGRWFTMSFLAQMANIGSEVERSIRWRRVNEKHFTTSYYRLLELLELTIDDPKNRKRLRELCRVREVLNDYFLFDNIYGSSDELWKNYFNYFAFAYVSEKEHAQLTAEMNSEQDL